jgi:hypothetical protein
VEQWPLQTSDDVRSGAAFEEQLSVDAVDPHDFRAPLTIEETIRVTEMVTRQLPEIMSSCETIEAESKNSNCPMCNSPLLTEGWQCFQCGLD